MVCSKCASLRRKWVGLLRWKNGVLAVMSTRGKIKDLWMAWWWLRIVDKETMAMRVEVRFKVVIPMWRCILNYIGKWEVLNFGDNSKQKVRPTISKWRILEMNHNHAECISDNWPSVCDVTNWMQTRNACHKSCHKRRISLYQGCDNASSGKILNFTHIAYLAMGAFMWWDPWWWCKDNKKDSMIYSMDVS